MCPLCTSFCFCPFTKISHPFPSISRICPISCKTRLLVSMFSCFFLLITFIDGYIRNVSVVSPSLVRKGKYFQSTLLGSDKKKSIVTFSQKKQKLLQKIQDKQTSCELKMFPLNDKKEIFIGDYTSVRETEPKFGGEKKKVHLC